MAENSLLNAQLVDNLRQNRTDDNRADIISRVAAQYRDGGLTDSERAAAEEILRTASRDAAIIVRQGLAETLMKSIALPRDIARTLARDIEAISLPLLQNAVVFSDEDLLEIIRDGGENRQKAIAQRENVSESLSTALVDLGSEEVVAALLNNETAVIPEAAFGTAMTRFGTAGGVVPASMAQRGGVPERLVEKLVGLVSVQLREHILAKSPVSPKLAEDLLLEARARALMSLAGERPDDGVDEQLVRQLHKTGKLNADLVIHALCVGDIDFFETALMVISGVSIHNTRLLIHDAGHLGLKALLERCGFPPPLFAVCRTALAVLRETRIEDAPDALSRYRRTVVERILTRCDGLPPEQIDYLLGKMDKPVYAVA